MKVMTLSKVGEDAVHKREGFRSAPYLDGARVATIGYGTTFYKDGRRVTLKDAPITEAQAAALFRTVTGGFEFSICQAVTLARLEQHEFDALVSFVYNIGEAGFRSSTVLRKLNVGNKQGAADAMLMWNKITVGGKKVVDEGVMRRRRAERQQFLGGAVVARLDQHGRSV